MENTRISYEIENIIAKLERAIKEEEAKRDAWRAVKIVTKKDGSAFANFAKNFGGARVTFPAYSLGGGKELTVTTWNPATGYISDTIFACTLPSLSTVYLFALECTSAWQSLHKSIRLSQFRVMFGSLMFLGVR